MKNKEVIVESMDPIEDMVFEAMTESKAPYDNMEKARALATIAHSGVTRKDGKTPYILHPRRVVKTLQEAGVSDREILAAAYLHDVLEDTGTKIEGEVSDRVVKLVNSLTKGKGANKGDYLRSLGGAPPGAMLIKLADRYDNLLDGSTTMSKEWLKKYLESTKLLLSVAMSSPDTKTPAGMKLFKKLKDLAASLSAS